MKDSSCSRGFTPILSLVLVAALALAIPLTVSLAQKAQIIHSYASEASKSGDDAWAQAKLAGKSDDEARKAAENAYNNTAQQKPPSEKESQQDRSVDQAKQQAIQQAGGDSSKVNPNTIKKIEQANGVTPSQTLSTTGQVCNAAGQECYQAYPDACTTANGQPGVRNCQKRGVCSGIGGGAFCGGAGIQWACSECVPNGQNPAAAPALPPTPASSIITTEQKRISDQQTIINQYCKGNNTCVTQKNLEVAAGYNVTTDGTLTKAINTTAPAPNQPTTVTTSTTPQTSSILCPNGICPPTIVPPGTECTGSQTKCSIGLEYSCENGYWGDGKRCPGGTYCTGNSCPNTQPQLPGGCTVGQTSCLNKTTEVVCVDGKYNIARACPANQECLSNSCEKIAHYTGPVPSPSTAECTDGRTKCADSRSIIKCVGGKFNTVTPCSESQKCVDGECKDTIEVNVQANTEPNKPASSLITNPPVPSITIPSVPQFSAESLLNRGYSSALRGDGKLITEQNPIPFLPNTVVNNTSYERMVVQSPDGSQTEITFGIVKGKREGDKIITNSETYDVQKNGEPIPSSVKLPMPGVSEVNQIDQGNLVNAFVKISSWIHDTIFGK